MFKSKVLKNTIMLYIMNIAKMVFPLLTLPYLTRILSEDMYGLVSYVKSCMIYIQLLIDFGFILSSVKDIVKANGNKEKIGYIVGNTFFSKFILAIISFLILIVMCFSIKILQLNITYVFLSFISVATTVFLADFLFRGIEKMQYITGIYLTSKGVAVILTFLVIKGDSDILWIPLLDIISHMISIIISVIIIKKLGIKIRISKIKECFSMLKNSFVYFMSSVATTAFSALNTVLVGIYISDLTQIAHWSLCINIISTIQGLYAPICNSIYPHMIKEKSLSFIHKVLRICMPIVIVGCLFSFFFAKTALMIVGGVKYISAYKLFQYMIPILFFSFPAQVYGWPALGAIGKEKTVTASTIIASVTHILGIIGLIILNKFTLIYLAILKTGTEMVFMLVRIYFVYKNKTYFVRGD